MDVYCERDRPPLARFIDIAAGRRHTCGLLADGRVQCWGGSSFFNDFYSGDYSEGYTGTASSWTTNSIVRIDAQGDLTCGLRTDASLFCWTGEGSFPRDRPLYWEQPRPYESGSYIDFATTDSQACALDLDGRAECWPLHHWDEPLTAAPLSRLGNLSFTAIDAGKAHVCGLHRDRAIYCWGSNDANQLNAPAGAAWVQISAGAGHTCALDTDGKAACWGDNSFGQATPARHSRFSALSAGELHTCGLRLDGSAECWGSDAEGQATPPVDAVFTELSSGALHTCGLAKTGEPRCWGLDAYGQATPPAALERFARLSASSWDSSDRVTCGLRDDGLAQCWGRYWNPQLPLKDGARFTKIVTGRDFACGLLLDGRASCWRYDAYSTYPDLNAVVADIPSDLKFIDLVIVGRRACGLTSGGAIRCWGAHQDLNERDLPSPPTGEHVAIAAKDWSACAISRNGIIECWSDSGELSADLRRLSLPQRGATSIGEHIDPGDSSGAIYRSMTLGNVAWYGPEGQERARVHGCALHQHQTVSCWGANEFGQASPPSGLRFSSVTAGGRHTCGITADGQARCWGADDAGQSTPPANANFTEIHAEHDSTCGLSTAGDVICWGDHGLSAPAQLVPFVVNLPEQHFTDIMELDRLGIFDGTECTTQRFCADTPLTRSTMAVWLDRLLHDEAVITSPASGAAVEFDDAPAELWWSAHAQGLLDLRAMTPCDAEAHHFCPNDYVSRAELEQALVHSLRHHLDSGMRSTPAVAFANAQVAISAVVESICIGRVPRACEQAAVTRGQAATVLNRFREHMKRLALPEFTSVSTDYNGGCGRRADGTVECWGEDGSGEAYVATDDRVLDVFYDGYYWCGRTVSRERACRGWDGYNYSHARESLALASRADIAFGSVYACGIEPDGALTCVGGVPTDGGGWPYEEANPSIPLAHEDRHEHIPGLRRYSTLLPQTGGFTQVAVGYLHRCALLLDGRAVCWGKNEFGEAVPPGDGRYSRLALGVNHTCGIRLDGTAECWGFDDDGRSSPPSIQMITPAAPSGPAAGILGDLQARPVRLQALAATDTVTCGLTSEGHIVCWGRYGSPSVEVEAQRDDSSEWWASETPTVRPPADIEGQVFASIDATDGYFCAERLDGSHRCWGSSSFRRSLDIDARFVEVSASDRYTCGHRVDGSGQCWDAWNDAHFHASTERFSSVTTASTYACGRAASAFASCWTLHPELPVPDEAAAGGFTQLSDSGHHTCVLAPDDAVDCWGRNDAGEATPPAGRSYAQISAGGLEGYAGGDIHYHAHTCGVGKDGALDCWGDDRFGQSTPPAGGDFVKVAASGIHACALRTDGEIVCWGWGYGDGRAPPASHDYSDVVVGAGGGFWFPYETNDGEIVHSAHTCGLRLDGIVDCWGTTYSPNKPYNRYEPDSRSRFTSISSGRSHVCGVRTDGAIECWGIPAFIAY